MTEEARCYHSELGCFVERISYDFLERTGALHMPEGSNCDMKNCIDLFMKIDDRVFEIRTYAGIAPDTKYLRRGDDWDAIP